MAEGLRDQSFGDSQVFPRTPVAELPRIQRASLRELRRNQESAQAQGGLLEYPRPDAVIPRGGPWDPEKGKERMRKTVWLMTACGTTRKRLAARIDSANWGEADSNAAAR